LNKTTYLAMACTLLLIVGGLYYFNRAESLIPPKPVQEANSNPAENISFSASSIVEHKDGKKLWELNAQTIQVDPTTKQAVLTDIKGVLYREDGSKIDLVARTGRVDSGTKDIFLEGEIKVVSSTGGVFTSAKARWSQQEQHIYGSGGITLTKEDTVITGDAIDSDAKIEQVKVQGNARAIKGGQPQ
jgi:LPS export ABC transporter protein LptC